MGGGGPDQIPKKHPASSSSIFWPTHLCIVLNSSERFRITYIWPRRLSQPAPPSWPAERESGCGYTVLKVRRPKRLKTESAFQRGRCTSNILYIQYILLHVYSYGPGQFWVIDEHEPQVAAALPGAILARRAGGPADELALYNSKRAI